MPMAEALTEQAGEISEAQARYSRPEWVWDAPSGAYLPAKVPGASRSHRVATYPQGISL